MARVIPRAAIDEYTRQLNLVSSSMKAKLAESLELIDFESPDALQAVIDLMQLYCSASADAAAVLAAQYYDAASEFCTGRLFGAVADSRRVAEATRIATLGIMDAAKDSVAAIEQLTARLDYETKRAAGDCAFYNGSLDWRKPKFARIPSGSETCDFCLMLASRGFVYNTRKAAGFLDHYHSGCLCRVTPGWDGTEVEGYDPVKLYDDWQDAVTAKAEERAERLGTSVEEERRRIMSYYENSAKHARQRARAARYSRTIG